MSRKTHLKVKIKNLAAEAGIIRLEERKAKQHRNNAKTQEHWNEHHRAFMDLKDHRKGIVRDVARINLLAYGFLRGRSYAQMENYTREAPRFNKVYEIIKRFGSAEDLSRWDAWKEEAEGHLKNGGLREAA